MNGLLLGLSQIRKSEDFPSTDHTTGRKMQSKFIGAPLLTHLS